MARHLLAVSVTLACAASCATSGVRRAPPDAVARANATPPSDPDASIVVAPGLGVGRPSPAAVPLAHIDEEAVRGVIRAHAAELRDCYARQLAKDPSLAGRVTLVWGVNEVGHAGRATQSSKGSTLPGDEVARCMMALIPTWKFPPTHDRGVAIVVHSWTFRPADAAGAIRAPAVDRAP
jgi:hypothetical protein